MVFMKQKCIRMVLTVIVLSSVACAPVNWVLEGYARYNQGREAQMLTNEEIVASAMAGLATQFLQETWQAAGTSVVPSKTMAPGELPVPTLTPAPLPTPETLFRVRVRSVNVWYKFYNREGDPGASAQASGPYAGSSIWDQGPIGTPEPSLSGQGDIVSMGVIGSYLADEKYVFPVVGTASGAEFCRLSVEAWMEISDLSADLKQTVGVKHRWRHGQEMKHAHLWLKPRSDDRDLVFGFVEPGYPVQVLEFSQDKQMARVSIPFVWTSCSAMERVET